MTSCTKTIIGIVVGISVIGLGPGLVIIDGFLAYRTAVHLVSETGHHAILKAGRDLLSQVPNPENWTPDGYKIHSRIGIPARMRLPEVLQDLSARSIKMDSDGYLVIEIISRRAPIGFCIYPEDFKPPDPFFNYGDLKLVEGLWYYDGEYNDPESEYAKRFDALLKKNKYGVTSSFVN